MKIQWYPRYPADYSRDTKSLSLAQHGAYTLLLDEQYNTGKPLPEDMMHLHRICNAQGQAEQAAVEAVIHRFFVRVQGGWVQPRAMAEIEKQRNISKKRRAAAFKSHGLELPLAEPDADASEVQMHGHLHLTSTSTRTPTGENKIAPVGANGRPRDEIWEALLGSCGIPLTASIPTSARGAYNKATADLKAIQATPESIKAHADAFRKKWPKVSLTPSALVRRWNECMVEDRR